MLSDDASTSPKKRTADFASGGRNKEITTP
jgi:hypothetical protein